MIRDDGTYVDTRDAPLPTPAVAPLFEDPVLDGLAATARHELGVPVALVSLVLPQLDRQAFAGLSGVLPDPFGTARETPLTHSFCRYVVHDRQPLIIDDARSDVRLRDNPAIDTLGVVAYAGFPVADSEGAIIGSLCAIDGEPRKWTRIELERLEALAAEASRRLKDGGIAGLDLAAPSLDQFSDVGQRSRLLLRLSEDLASTLDVVEVARAVSEAATTHLGCVRAGIWLRQTVIPRELAGLPEGKSLDPAVLCWVRHDSDDDSAVAAFEKLALDASTAVGAAALESEARYFESRDAQAAAFPGLQHVVQNGQRRIFLPLISHGRLLGTLALLWSDTGPISDAQRLTVGALASYAAQAVERASMRQNRIDALLTLQRSLMPSLPETDEVDLAARYVPASDQNQVGGDWYDALVPSPGRVEVMLGDVMGHDIDAAATMGQFRTMLRVLAATIDAGPAEQVERLDRAIADLDVAGMATLIYGHLARCEAGSSDEWEFVWTNAGHPPPVVLLPSGEVEVLDQHASDLFVGVMPGQARREHRHLLPAGSTLVMYTDGLVERRGELLEAGLERLHHAVARGRRKGLERLLDGLLAELLNDRREDDVAILAVRLPRHGA